MYVLSLIAAFAGLSSALANQVETGGVYNCYNKCDKVFNMLQYAIVNQPNATTFEYRSCILGCNKCSAELAVNATSDQCFPYCKNLNYASLNIRKGVIEPDKACLIGCVINLCQDICISGTDASSVTPQNQDLWWGLGGNGCSVKQGLGYVQSPLYTSPNSPNGQGATSVNQCCTNAQNLCDYVGSTTNNPNYNNVIIVAQSSCLQFVPSQAVSDICAFYDNVANCGAPGMAV